LRREGFEPTMK